MGMQLSRNEIVFGLPAVTARNIMAKHLAGCDWFYLGAVEQALETEVCFERGRGGFKRIDYKAAKEQAPVLLQKMIEEGYVEKGEVDNDREHGERQSYAVTEKGHELSRVRFIKRMTRSKAIEQLRAFIERVEAVNAGEYTKIVTDVWLYGSMITDAEDIGDVDVTIKLAQRPGHCGYPSHKAHNDARAKASGKNLSFFEELYFGENEVTTFLKDRRPHISINGFTHGCLDEIRDGYRQIVKDGVVLWDAIPSA